MARCKGKTKAGTLCKNQALEDSDYCRTHQPASQAKGVQVNVEKWLSDQSTVSTIGGATLGAMMAGPLGALIGGAIGAYMSGYHGKDKENQD